MSNFSRKIFSNFVAFSEYPNLKNFCRGPSLLCMNEILLRLGEFNEVMDAKDERKPAAKKRCLAACENQVHNGAKIFLRVH